MEKIIESQRKYFLSGKTLDIETRLNNLKMLKLSIFNHIPELIDAFKKDFNKCEMDCYSTEIGITISELNYMIKHLKKLAKPKRVHTSLLSFPAKGKIIAEPFGVSLIVAPWNYPFQLAICPLIGALGAGNTAILKPSINTLNVSRVIEKILDIFPKELVYVTFNNKKEREELFDMRYDYVFYTGSSPVAKILMEKQAKFLTPATLELGGKSPCIVDLDANIVKSAKRIVWGKFLNAGQTCVAPDYILVHKDIKQEFIDAVVAEIKNRYYYEDKLTNDFPFIVNQKQADYLKSMIDENEKNIVFGGKINERLIEPTVIDNVAFDNVLMQEEIFGPIMPIIEFENLEETINIIKSKEKPLALYYFGLDKKKIKYVLENCSFGGGAINDTIMHVAEENLPFGGVGNSGMGRYHKDKTFATFTHFKSVLVKSANSELNLKYPPYSKGKTKIVKWFFKIK